MTLHSGRADRRRFCRSLQFPFERNRNGQRRVAVVVGSLRKGSFNRRLAQAIVASPPAQLALEIVEIRDLPLCNVFDDAGAIKKPETTQFVDKFLAAFADWIERNAATKAA
jgi:hypothetical protein